MRRSVADVQCKAAAYKWQRRIRRQRPEYQACGSYAWVYVLGGLMATFGFMAFLFF